MRRMRLSFVIAAELQSTKSVTGLQRFRIMNGSVMHALHLGLREADKCSVRFVEEGVGR